jgi:hypothetical protein
MIVIKNFKVKLPGGGMIPAALAASDGGAMIPAACLADAAFEW